MSFHAEALAIAHEPAHVAEPAAAAAAPTAQFGEALVRLQPKYADGVRAVRVRWSLTGAVDAPLVIVQGGISADRRPATIDGVEGWWSDLVGDGRAIDTRARRVLSIDWLSTADLGDDALAIGSEDQADAIAAVLDALGVRRAAAFVGASYGAMVGLAFAARHPQRLGRLVALAGAHRAHPLSVALRNIQREVVRFAQARGDASAGLDLARRIAMTTYRGEREFAERCAAAPRVVDGRFHFAEEGWLAAAGARFARRFTTGRFLSLSESIDLHAIAPEAVRVPTTLIGFASDRVVPLADLCELQRRCGAPATLHVLDSRYGHDAFLKEPQQVGTLLREALVEH